MNRGGEHRGVDDSTKPLPARNVAFLQNHQRLGVIYPQVDEVFRVDRATKIAGLIFIVAAALVASAVADGAHAARPPQGGGGV